MKKITLLLLVTLLTVSTSLLAQNTLSKTFSGVKKIKITTAAGSCQLIKGTDATVKVDLQHSYDDNRFEPRMEMEGDRLVIKELFHGNSFSGNSNWKVTVPDNLPITFSTGSGDFEASNMSLDVDINTGSGNLNFSNAKGNIEASTGSGEVELINFEGEVRANTGSGDMRVENCRGDINLNCGSGDLKLTDNKAVISANTGSGRIDARNVVLTGSSNFNTGSGDAEVILSATPAYDLSVNSGSGDAELSFNGNEMKGEIIMQASKKNGRIVAPFEFDKTEELNNWGDNVTVKKTSVKGNASNRISISTGSGSAVLKK